MNELQRLAVGILAIVLALLPLHPFLSTALGSQLGGSASAFGFVISAWKEIVLVVFIGLVAALSWQQRDRFRFDSIDLAIVLFVLVSCITGVLFTGNGFPDNLPQVIWGAKYGLFFFVTFFAVRQLTFSAQEKRLLVTAALVPAVVVIGFGLLQKTVLPEEFLIAFGYNDEYGVTESGQGISYCHKIENRITHQEFCRIQSTLSGPNQLGAYLLIVLPLVLFLTTRTRQKWQQGALAVLLAAGVGVLFLTWSRSAWIGMLAAIAALFVVQSPRPFAAIEYLAIFGSGIVALFFPALVIDRWDELKPIAVIAASGCLVLLLASFVWNLRQRAFLPTASVVFPLFLAMMIFVRARFDTFFWNIILRPSSSQGHWERWSDGAYYIFKYPLGLGLGDAGPASARFARPGETGFLPESWYLQVGLESGLLGLALFLTIIVLVTIALLQNGDWLSKALVLSLAGISAASLFLHSWESAAVALSFWILCGVALARTESPTLWQRIGGFYSRFFQKSGRL